MIFKIRRRKCHANNTKEHTDNKISTITGSYFAMKSFREGFYQFENKVLICNKGGV